MSNYLILKLSDKDTSIPFGDSKALTEKANGSWRFTPARLKDVDRVLLLFRGQVLEEYTMNDEVIYNRKENRVTFDLEPVSNSKLKGKSLDYPTANPASLLPKNELQNRIK